VWLPYVEVDEVGAATEPAHQLGASVLLASREGPAGWRSVVATPTVVRSPCGSRSDEFGVGWSPGGYCTFAAAGATAWPFVAPFDPCSSVASSDSCCSPSFSWTTSGCSATSGPEPEGSMMPSSSHS